MTTPPGDLTPLRDLLKQAGYGVEGLSRLGAMPRGGENLPLWEIHQRTAGTGRLETLARLFMLALPEDAQAADAALRPLGIAPLLKAGLLEFDAATGKVRCVCCLLPVGEQFFARDFPSHFSGRPVDGEYVLGVGLASLQTMNLTARIEGARVLDLGTGQGFQAVSASPWAGSVVAVDINPRALKYAAFSAGLNGARNIEFRRGSFFEPVEQDRPDRGGEGFGVIATNPPFMIGPDQGIMAFSTTLKGDDVVRHIAQHAPAYLRDGGWCTMVCNWHHAGEDDWPDRVRTWLEGCGCDAWLVRSKTMSPRAYTLQWLGEMDTPKERITGEVMRRWLDYYRDLGVGAISYGALVLRKRAGKNWFRADSHEYTGSLGHSGDQVERIFASQTLLSRLPEPAGLLDERLIATPNVGLSHALTLTQTRGELVWKSQGATLRQPRGFPFAMTIDQVMTDLLAACDGRLTLRQACGAYAARTGMDLPGLLNLAASAGRTLLEFGYLSPAPDAAQGQQP